MMTLKLRGHHLESVKELHEGNRSDAIRKLAEDDYILGEDHPFVNFLYGDMRKLFSDGAQRFEIVVDEADFICSECPKLKSDRCDPRLGFDPKGVGRVFLEGIDSRDIRIVKQYGFNVGEIYTAKQIRDKLSF